MATIDEVKNRIAVCNAKSANLNQTRQYNIGQRESIQKQLDAAIKTYNEKYGTSISVDNIASELSSVCEAKEREIEAVENMIALIEAGNYEEAMKLAGEPVAVKETSVQQQSQPLDMGVVNTGATPVGMVVQETVADESGEVEAVSPPEVAGSVTDNTTTSTVVEETAVEEEAVPSAPPLAASETVPSAPPVTEVPVAPPPAAPAMPVMPTAPKAPVAPSAPSMTTQPISTGTIGSQPAVSSGLDGFNGALSGFSTPGAGGLGGMENLPTPPQQKPVTDFKDILGGSDFPTASE